MVGGLGLRRLFGGGEGEGEGEGDGRLAGFFSGTSSGEIERARPLEDRAD